MGKSIIFLIIAILSASPSWGRMNVAMMAGGPTGCTVTETPETSCSDTIDNDCDGLIDSADTADCGGGGSAPTFHSWAESSDGTATTITTKATNAALTVSSGDTILVWVSGVTVEGQESLNPSVTCGSNTISTEIGEIFSVADHWFSVMLALSNAATSSSVCTATLGGNYQYVSIQAMSISSAAASSSVDQYACNAVGCATIATSSTGITSQNITTTSANSLLVGWAMAWNNDHTWTGANSFVVRATGLLAGAATKEVTATNTYPSGNFMTINTADQYLSFIVNIKGL